MSVGNIGWLICKPCVLRVMHGKREARQDIWPSMSDANKQNPIVSAGDVKRLYQPTLGAVRLLTNLFHVSVCSNTK